MRQVPYCVIGDGRLARHLLHWGHLIHCPTAHWCRQHGPEMLLAQIKKASVIVVAISDSSIQDVVSSIAPLLVADQSIVHCSGALTIEGAWSCHPMMTFGQQFYTQSHYEAIRWVVDQDLPDELMSHFIKHRLSLPSQKKALYHAWCVLAGNGTSLLWQQCLATWQNEFGWSKEEASHFATACLKTGLSGDANRLSGPMVRGDQETIQRNLASLIHQEEKACYQSLCHIAEDLL